MACCTQSLIGTPTHFGMYSMSEVLQLKTMFDMFDVDNSKFISLDEFVNNSEWENMFHMKDNAFSMFHKIDRNGDGQVSFMELMAVTFPLASNQQLKVWKAAFVHYILPQRSRVGVWQSMCKMVSRIHGVARRTNDPGGLSTLQIVRLEKRFKRVASSASGTVLVEEIEKILRDPTLGLGDEVPRRSIEALRDVRRPLYPLAPLQCVSYPVVDAQMPHVNMTLDEFLSLVEGVTLRITEEALAGAL